MAESPVLYTRSGGRYSNARACNFRGSVYSRWLTMDLCKLVNDVVSLPNYCPILTKE